MKTFDVLFTPADWATLNRRNLDDTTCIVLDVFRATSTMVTALAHGAEAIIPVAEIPEALDLRRRDPTALLAGERDGVRIRAGLTGGVDFDLGNSPREFTREKVSGRTIVMTTTNGTRALRACAHAATVLIGSWLNLKATAECVARRRPEHLMILCSGTLDQAAFEDALAAGALGQRLGGDGVADAISDSALMARRLFQAAQENLAAAAMESRNARRLLRIPELKDDVAFCLQRDVFDLAAVLQPDGKVMAA